MERREAGACAGGGQQEGSRDVGDGEEAGCHTDPDPNPKQKSKFKPSHRELEGKDRTDQVGTIYGGQVEVVVLASQVYDRGGRQLLAHS